MALAIGCQGGSSKGQADCWVAAGIKLADTGDFRDAITLFIKADALFPRSIHDCNIAVAYLKLKSDHRAWFYFERCVQRAKGSLPAWVAEERAKLIETFKAGGHGRLEIKTNPSDTRLTVSALGVDVHPEAPFVLWAPLGLVSVKAELEGYETITKTIQIEGGAPQILAFALPVKRSVTAHAAPEPKQKVTIIKQGQPISKPENHWATIALGVGGAAIIGGGGIFFAALDDQDQAARARTTAQWSSAVESMQLWEAVTYGLWGTGAGLMLAGWFFWDTPPTTARVQILPSGIVGHW